MLQLMRSLDEAHSTLGVPLPYGCGVVTVRWLCNEIYYSRFQATQSQSEMFTVLERGSLFRFGFDLRHDQRVVFAVKSPDLSELFGDHVLGVAASLDSGCQHNAGPMTFATLCGAAECLAEMIVTTHSCGPYLAAIVQRQGTHLEASIEVFRQSHLVFGWPREERNFIVEKLMAPMFAHA
jgi:hypothetical protein